MPSERVTRVLAAIPQPIMAHGDPVSDGEVIAIQIPTWAEEERLELLTELLTTVTQFYSIAEGEALTEEEDRALRPIFTALVLGIQAGQTIRDMSMAGTL